MALCQQEGKFDKIEQMKTIFQGKTKNGKPIIIRYPVKSDVKAMLEYINKLSQERTFIRMQGEIITFTEEKKYLEKLLKKIRNKQTIQLLVFDREKLVGVSDINMQEKIEKHVGLFGITVAKEFRREGIGSLLMDLIFNEAIKNISDLEIIKLGCFSNNTLALKMYKKFGFKEYGRLPNGIKLHDKYVDHIYMYKYVSVPFSACPEKGTKEKTNP